MLTSVLQPTHLLIILFVALVVLGPKRLPDAGRALGQGLREFKSSITADHQDDPHVDVIPVTPAERSLPQAEPPR